MHRLLQRLAAGIVFAVGNHEQHFLLQLGAFLQMVGRGDQRVVKRRAAAGFNFLQAFLQFLDVTGVILVQVVLVIEIDDKNLVIFIAGDRKSTRLNSQSLTNLVCRLLLEKKKKKINNLIILLTIKKNHALN